MSTFDGFPDAETPPSIGLNDSTSAFEDLAWLETGGFLTQAPCYASGTHIATARGEVPVENLRVGEMVVTAQDGEQLQPVVWIGHRRVLRLRRRLNAGTLAPVRISAGALGDGTPHRDLRVSPDHAMFIDGRLVPAGLLVNGVTIVQEFHHDEVTYWHVELPSHGLLVAEGALSESYLDDGNRGRYANPGLITLFKDALTARGVAEYDAAACFRPLRQGPALDAIRRRLAARAEGLRLRA